MMITVKDIFFQYPRSDYQLVLELLEVEQGEKIAIAGPSGIGKTTLLQIIAGILLPEKGVVQISGHQINGMSDKARRQFRIANMGFIFQDFKLLEYLRVKENILLPFKVRAWRTTGNAKNNLVNELAEKLGIPNKMKRYPRELSHGERQRVAIARALINDPDLIFADEPTGNLDPVNKGKIMDVIFEECRQCNSTLLMVTHDQHLLGRFDRTIDLTNMIHR